MVEYVLRPLSGDGWALVKSKIEDDALGSGTAFEEASIHESTDSLGSTRDGVVLDANREVRVKLYMGQVSTNAPSPRYPVVHMSACAGIHGVVLARPVVPSEPLE